MCIIVNAAKLIFQYESVTRTRRIFYIGILKVQLDFHF